MVNSVNNSGNNYEIKKNADNYNNWQNSSENFSKSCNGEKVEDFKMFDFNAETYSSDLKEFAQEYINKFDSNKDGKLNENEYWELNGLSDAEKSEIYQSHAIISEKVDVYNQIISNSDIDGDKALSLYEYAIAVGYDVNKELTDAELNELVNNFNVLNSNPSVDLDTQNLKAEELVLGQIMNLSENPEKDFNDFSNFLLVEDFRKQSFDGDKSSITANEYAAKLMADDVDWANYDIANDYVDDVIDGKLNYNTNLYGAPSGNPTNEEYITYNYFKEDIYNAFFAE